MCVLGFVYYELGADCCVVVGDEEMRGRQVNVRYRDDTSAQDRGKPVAIDEAVEKLVALREDKGMYNPFGVRVEKDEKAEKA